MFRFASRANSSFSLSFALDIYFLLRFCDFLGGNRCALVLRVHRNQPDLPLVQAIEINHPDAASLAGARHRPTDLAATARARHDIARLGIERQPSAELAELLRGPVVRP